MRLVLISVILGCLLSWPVPACGEDPGVATARRARDRGDVPTLRKEIAEIQKRASEKKSFEDYLRLALLHNWMCEAAEGSNDRKLVKEAAEAGVAAAEVAVRLNPKSSDAHQLLADSLGLLIPNVFGGGMRYGNRSTEEADKAIELDPKNPNAYVTRAISYLYSPEEFGGSKQRGFELLQKAVEANPLADTPHIWLAQFYLDTGKIDDALREIDEARRLNPGRIFAQYVYDQVTAARKKAVEKR
jgi:tetratricopeptide (TPR) repeat protein